MSQQGMNGANIGAALQQMRRKTVSKSMGADPLVNPQLLNRCLDRLVNQRLIDMMTPGNAG